MQLPTFYEPFLTDADILYTLSEESQKHATLVLRLKKNDYIHLTNGKGLFCRAIIETAEKKNCVVRIESVQFFPKKEIKVAIAISLLKNNSRLEWFLEKAAEMGVSTIIPIITKRTEKQQFRFDRLNAILISAMVQSGQYWLAELYQPIKFLEILEWDNYDTKLIAHCIQEEKMALANMNIDSNSIILIGPEGDFTNEEVAAALEKKFFPVTLGNTRLRTETAGIMAAALLVSNQH